MKRVQLVVISFLIAVAFLSIMGFQFLGDNTSDTQYLNSEQLVSRFVTGGVTAVKIKAIAPFQIDANYEAFADGMYNYFVDVDNHLIRLITRQKDLSMYGSPLSTAEIKDKAAELFQKAYGYNLTGIITVINRGSMGDDGNRIRVDVVETFDEIETGNKAIMFLFADGTLSKATFLSGTKIADSIASEKEHMIKEDVAEKIAIAAVKNKVKSSDVVIIKSADPQYSATIQTYDNKTFWSLEFKAEFANETGEKMQAFFGVQIDVYNGQVLTVYSSLN